MSQRDADNFISNNEREFILKALAEECRLDGRRPYDLRKPKFQFSLDDRSATVAMGSTRVMSVVTASLEAPFPDRPSEGPLRFNVEFSPMASPAFEPGKPGEDAIQVARLIERGLRQSGAVDQEALCVVAGRKVWSLRVDCHVLDHGGNLLDAAFLSALSALLAFRKPEVEVGGESGNEVLVHPPEVREPVPLTIHHLPVAVTFALFQGGDLLVVDPSWKEAAAAAGLCTVVMNPAREVCCVHKAEGVGLTSEQFMRCVRLAADKAAEVVGALKAALEQHEVARVQARVRRHQMVAGLPDGQARNVMVLGAKDPTGGAAAAAAAAAATAAGAGPAAARGRDEAAAAAADDEDMDADISDDDDEDEDDDSNAGAERSGILMGTAAGATVGAARGRGGEGAKGGGGAKGGDSEMREAEEAADGRFGGDSVSGRQPPEGQARARLSGPLVPESGPSPSKAKRAKAEPAAGAASRAGAGAGAEAGTSANGQSPGGGRKGGGGLPAAANQRGKDNLAFDELEAIAAVIAGVPPGGPAPGAPEPDLAAAVKTKSGKQPKVAGGKVKERK